jgi:hypothetical protein
MKSAEYMASFQAPIFSQPYGPLSSASIPFINRGIFIVAK